MNENATAISTSLRARLLRWLLLPGFLLTFGLLAKNYLTVSEMANRIQDRLLVALAVTISEHAINSGGDLLSRDIELLLEQFTRENTYYRVQGPDGAFVTGDFGLPRLPEGVTLEPGVPHFYNAHYRNEDVRAVTMKYLVANPSSNIYGWVTIDVSQTRRERDNLIYDELLGSTTDFLVLMFLGGVFAWIGVSRGLAPLRRLQQAIRRRSTDDLRPIRHAMPKEVTEVVKSLNALLARLESSITANQRFIADASHQLRTPLATVQAEAEWALRNASNPEDRQALERIVDQTRQTARLASQLLNLARVSPEGRKAVRYEKTDLLALAASVTSGMVRQAIRHDIDLGFDDQSEGMNCQIETGNEVLLQEMLSNLIDNAIVYGTPGTIVTVRLIGGGVAVGPVLEVEDNGPGIPKEDRKAVLERFARLDEQNGQGCGLGLAIVREVADAHRARLKLEDGKDSKGLKVRIEFPL
ncbi:MAG: sensor histidine kinase [Thalassospira sp.]|uniref:sensor histidine kinase n=1 Tax=Thalassospira sp. TaxID=1912094 RepID=UPI001B1767E7|nr:sensor histidine kinase [Thalassospira sp.]MBO6579729.1 sensor histidine kinase [Thalassospira sp.]MBO6803080.1 sensor histidine kinase [Thalassospira sp.]MBO6817094.1 sensor histidine kinase [Thalassospira sp.]MBO6888306.1 sensor histidine kinase [Thalassospira sp.]